MGKIRIPKREKVEEQQLARVEQQKPPDPGRAPSVSNAVMQAKTVVNLRRTVNQKKHQAKVLREKFALENKRFFDELRDLESALDNAEWQLRQMAIDHYAATEQAGKPEKELLPGVMVRVLHKLEYDPEVAYDWCYAHNICLRLDVKEFEKMARAKLKSAAMAWVSPVDEPQGIIASNLAEEMVLMEAPEASRQAQRINEAAKKRPTPLPAARRPRRG